jgi:hypothetical protein
MNETEKPYRHSKLHGKCVASCNECIVEDPRYSERRRIIAIIERERPMIPSNWVRVVKEIMEGK